MPGDDGGASSEALVEIWLDWVSDHQVDELLDQDQLIDLTEELANNDDLLDGLYNLYVVVWGFTTAELDNETRSVREVIGDDLSDTMVRYAKNNEPDEATIRIIFRNEATEAMFGKILYEGITEFLSRVDIISKLLDQLPLIGGIKGSIENNFPEGVKTLLEGRIKEFLGNFSGAAAEKAMNYVLSPDHVDDFCEIQAEVLDHLLNKSVNELLPEDEALKEFRDSVWSSFQQQVQRSEENKDRIKRFLKTQGDRSVDQFLPDETPDEGVDLFAKVIDGFLDDSEAEEWFERYLESD